MLRTLKRLFSFAAYWLIAVPLLLLLVTFALSNQQDVMLALWPLPFTATLPLYLLLLVLPFACLLLGWLLGWIGQHKTRREARQSRREIARLRGMIASAPSVTTGGTTTTMITARTLSDATVDAQNNKDRTL